MKKNMIVMTSAIFLIAETTAYADSSFNPERIIPWQKSAGATIDFSSTPNGGLAGSSGYSLQSLSGKSLGDIQSTVKHIQVIGANFVIPDIREWGDPKGTYQWENGNNIGCNITVHLQLGDAQNPGRLLSYEMGIMKAKDQSDNYVDHPYTKIHWNQGEENSQMFPITLDDFYGATSTKLQILWDGVSYRVVGIRAKGGSFTIDRPSYNDSKGIFNLEGESDVIWWASVSRGCYTVDPSIPLVGSKADFISTVTKVFEFTK
jgi:hypothetical protein